MLENHKSQLTVGMPRCLEFLSSYKYLSEPTQENEVHATGMEGNTSEWKNSNQSIGEIHSDSCSEKGKQSDHESQIA